MGSSGTQSFSDYPGSSGGGGGAGGGGKADKCEAELIDLTLEEVALSTYFTKHKKAPAEKTKVRLRERLVGGRIAAETEADGDVIGYVPTA